MSPSTTTTSAPKPPATTDYPKSFLTVFEATEMDKQETPVQDAMSVSVVLILGLRSLTHASSTQDRLHVTTSFWARDGVR